MTIKYVMFGGKSSSQSDNFFSMVKGMGNGLHLYSAFIQSVLQFASHFGVQCLTQGYYMWMGGAEERTTNPGINERPTLPAEKQQKQDVLYYSNKQANSNNSKTQNARTYLTKITHCNTVCSLSVCFCSAFKFS